ncbi:MAG TPA: glycosyltransferase family 4 protein [Candidatus Binatia bacterium]
MRIALVHKRLDRHGGTERDLFRTAEGLRDLGHEVHLFCSEYGVAPPKNVMAHRVPVIPLGRTLRLWSFAWFGRQAVTQARYDVVVGFGRLPSQHVLRSGGGTHRGFLERMGQAGGLTRRIWQAISLYHQSLLAIEKRQYDAVNSRKIIAVSEQVKRDIIAQYAVPAEKIVVLYNGVDLSRFQLAKRKEIRDQIRNRWNIPWDSPLVLFVGSGFRRKGLDHLLSICNSPRLDRVFLLVVGADARLGRYQARADVVAPGRIVFAGRQDEIENYYAAADVVALPSLQEAFGNVVLEALAAGLPVLVSRVVGAAEIVRGFLSEGIVDLNLEPEKLEEKLLWLLEKSKDPCCMRQARSLAEEYSWETHFLRLETLLMESCRSSVGADT